ncbi:MAG: class I SAM-dependent methyltransferase [Bacteroidetes bacterium]|nr:class I SAM-dependent methyltransferase [Bacteroidota bacterium]
MIDDNIYTNGQYFKNNSTWDVEDSPWKSDVIIDILKSNHIEPANIIEVGCGAGGILENLSGKCSFIKSLQGFDISPQAIEIAKRKETDKLLFFNEDITLRKDIRTDLLLVIDVLEHVEDFYGFLRKLKPLSQYFIFHIPLDLSCRTVLKPHVMLQQRNAVGHIHYFSEEMVFWFLKDTGYEVIDFQYTKPAIDVDVPGSVKRSVKKILRNFSFGVQKKLSVKLWGGYSLMILSK